MMECTLAPGALVSRIATRIAVRTAVTVAASSAVLAALACAAPQPTLTAHRDAPTIPVTRVAHTTAPSGARAGIAIVGSGGVAGIERAMVLDSATGHFMTVTRRACGDDATCAPIDSASGTLPTDDVAHIYAVVAHERVFALREAYGVCDGCADQTLFTTAVVANNRRTVITSASETTPQLLG